MTIGVLKETLPETRVSLLPEQLASLKKLSIDFLIENNAGEKAFVADALYETAGATIASREQVIGRSKVILCLQLPDESEFHLFKSKTIIGYFQPLYRQDMMEKLKQNGVTVCSLDMLPRNTRAQTMDILSSQANIAGYKAVLQAANLLPHYFPMLMTAAGSIPPAKVLILGAGVAGLQAIATARRLGGVVEVFDTRPSVKEEVMSLGAKFIEVEGAADASSAGGYAVEQNEQFLERQKNKIAASVAKADVVITTAQIFGKQAPILISEAMIESMKKGSVIVDLAAATGGNTPLTQNNETVIYNGVRIIGDSHLATSMPYDASKMYGKNISNFLQLIINKEGELQLDFSDELIKGACVVTPD